MGAAEAKIQTSVSNWLTVNGCKVIKTVALTKSGNADLVICYRGYYVEMEIKVPGEECRRLQTIKAQETVDAGGYSFCIHSLAEAKEAIRDMNIIRRIEDGIVIS